MAVQLPITLFFLCLDLFLVRLQRLYLCCRLVYAQNPYELDQSHRIINDFDSTAFVFHLNKQLKIRLELYFFSRSNEYSNALKITKPTANGFQFIL